MMDLPNLTKVETKYHLDVPFWLNGIFRTVFKTAKWNPVEKVFVVPETNQNLKKWEQFSGHVAEVVTSLHKANLFPHSREIVVPPPAGDAG